MTFTDIRWVFVPARPKLIGRDGMYHFPGKAVRTLQVLVDGKWIDVPEVRET